MHYTHITITKEQLEEHKACKEALPLWQELMPDGSWTGEWTPLHACWLAVADGALAESVGALGWLEQHGLVPSVLPGADVRGANLAGADLSGANLAGASFAGADLRSAELAGANLWGANLSDADLRGADFWGADFWRTHLWGANLSDARYS